MSEETTILKAMSALLNKYFGEPENKHPEISVQKSYDEELKQATFLVLSPNEVDLHGDIYDETEVRKACHNFQIHCQKANLFHAVETDTASIVESYISPTDFMLGETLIKKGSWLQVWQIHDDVIWDSIKNGDINGVSVGCAANYEVLEDDNG